MTLPVEKHRENNAKQNSIAYWKLIKNLTRVERSHVNEFCLDRGRSNN
jgi:hypothetical protein